MENLKLGCRDFEGRSLVYKLLSEIYKKGKEQGRPLTQRQVLNIGTDVFGCLLYENTLRRYIRGERP